MMFGWFFILLLAGTTDVSNELLDYIPTDAYWQTKAVPVSPQRMIDEIAMSDSADIDTLIAELGSDQFAARDAAARRLIAMGPEVISKLEAARKSPNPEVAARAGELISQFDSHSKSAAVRRLMAIRTLGELKAKEALPELHKSLQSREMFVAEYAERAINAIDPSALAASQPKRPAPRDADVWLLPKSTAMVAQISLERTGPVDYKAVAAKFPRKQIPADADMIINEMVSSIIDFADQTGNFRIETVTLGLSDDFSGSTGWFNVTVKCTYDAKALTNYLKKNAEATQSDDGTYRIGNDDSFCLFIPSNDRFAVLVGPDGDVLPVAEFNQAIANNFGTIKENAPMVELIRSINKAGPVWCGMLVSPTIREASKVLAPVKTLTAETTVTDNTTRLDIKFAGDDPDEVQKSVETFAANTRIAAKQASEFDAENPMLKPIIKAFGNVTTEFNGNQATLTFNFDSTSPFVILATPFIGARADVEAEIEVEEEPALPPP